VGWQEYMNVEWYTYVNTKSLSPNFAPLIMFARTDRDKFGDAHYQSRPFGSAFSYHHVLSMRAAITDEMIVAMFKTTRSALRNSNLIVIVTIFIQRTKRSKTSELYRREEITAKCYPKMKTVIRIIY
jgi:hypothetical protein